MEFISVVLWQNPINHPPKIHPNLLSTFHCRASSFCCPSMFFSLEPLNSPPIEKQNFNRFWKAFSYVIFLLQRKFPLLKIAPFFPTLELPLPLPLPLPPPQLYMQFQKALILLHTRNDGFNGITYKELLLFIVTLFFRI